MPGARAHRTRKPNIDHDPENRPRHRRTGQDGAYLAELLFDKGYEVHGIKRRTSLFNTDRIDHLYHDRHEAGRPFYLHHGDMLLAHAHPPAGAARRGLQHAALPTNLYGPGDNCGPDKSHVIPALMRKFHAAKEAKAPTVRIWGTGTPRLEFLCSEDIADACVFLMSLPDEQHATVPVGDDAKAGRFEPPLVDIGSGADARTKQLAPLVRQAVCYAVGSIFDTAKPDGTLRKLIDVSFLHRVGSKAPTDMRSGPAAVYPDFLAARTCHSANRRGIPN